MCLCKEGGRPVAEDESFVWNAAEPKVPRHHRPFSGSSGDLAQRLHDT